VVIPTIIVIPLIPFLLIEDKTQESLVLATLTPLIVVKLDMDEPGILPGLVLLEKGVDGTARGALGYGKKLGIPRYGGTFRLRNHPWGGC